MGKRRNKEKNSGLGKLVVYSKKYMVVTTIAIIGAVIANILSLLGPNKISEMTNVITAGLFSSIDIEKITSIGTTLLIIYVVSVVLNLIQGYILADVIQNITKNLRTDISKKINRLPMSYYH